MSRRANRLAAFARNLVPLIVRQADGARALADVARLLETERWVSFDRFHDTSTALVELYEQAGAAAEVTAIPTGAGLGSGRWVIQEAADVRWARAEVVAPQQLPLLDWSQNPWHVARWSNSTPAGGVTGELRVIDDEDQLKSLPRGALAGRVLLTRLSPSWRGKVLADLAPLAVICDTPAGPEPTTTAWLSLGWGGLPLCDAPGRPVVLVLSPHRGDALRRLAASNEPVRLHVDVHIDRYAGTHDVVSGLLRGRDDPQDEVWAVAHSAEPGAADNTSGVVACLEAVRLLRELIASGHLPPPRRSIRMLHGYECYGFFAYLEQVRRLQPPLAGVVADCVGLRPELCQRRLEWHDTIPMSAGFVNELGARLLQAVLRERNPGYRLHRAAFFSTSDTLLGDPQYGFPCTWLATYDTRAKRGYDAYHSSADRPDVLHPDGLAVAAAGLAAYLYLLADGATGDAAEWAGIEERALAKRLAEPGLTPEREEYYQELHRAGLERLKRWQWGAGDLTPQPPLRRRRGGANDDGLRGDSPSPRAERGLGGEVPRRTAPLAPTLENTPAHIAERIRAAKLPQWALYWADGRRTIAEIADLLGQETGQPVAIDQLSAYFAALADLGFVEVMPAAELLDAERLTADLLALGLVPGSDVVVHSSLSAIGPVRGGADTVIDALLAALGADGTLVMPSFNHGAAEVFNPRTTPSTNGAITDAFWRRAGVLRSEHPTHAVAAVGPRAADYLRDHTANGVWTADSPLGRLVHSGGYILSLGVTHTRSTVYHVAEMSLPCGCLDAFGKTQRVVGDDGQVREVRGLAWRSGNCPVRVARLDEELRGRSVQRHGLVGRAEATLVPAVEVFKARRAHIMNVCPRCPVKPEG